MGNSSGEHLHILCVCKNGPLAHSVKETNPGNARKQICCVQKHLAVIFLLWQLHRSTPERLQ